MENVLQTVRFFAALGKNQQRVRRKTTQLVGASGNKEQTKWPVIQPQTGERVTRQHSVSVITADPAAGEVLSTALYVAGENETEQILKRLNGKMMNIRMVV